MDEKKKQQIMIWTAVGVFVALGIIILAITENGSIVNNVDISAVTTKKGPSGVPSNSIPNSPEIPQASTISKSELPEGAIELLVSSTGFSPNSFTVNAGQKITLAITSKDKSHTFAFKDPSLSSVSLNAGAGKTSAVNFIAPTKTGDYIFRCDLPGHEDNGEIGTMIVR